MPYVLAVIDESAFYVAANRDLFLAMLWLHQLGRPIDLVTVYDRLMVTKQLADCGGHQYLADCFMATPTGAYAEHYAGIVHDCHVARQLIHAANEILRDAYDRTGSAGEMVAAAVAKIQAIT